MNPMQTTLTIIALVIAGLVFFLLEVVTPMFGVLVAMGVVALGGAVWLCFTVSPMLGLVVLAAMVAIVPVYMTVLVKLLPESPLGRRLFLGRAPKADGTGTPEAAKHESLVGRQGVAETPLRPSGAIRIDGRRVIATAETGMIEKGQAVKVVRAVGTNVVVRRTQGE